MNLIQRLESPTPKFFRKLRNIALVLGGIGTAVLGAPVVLPPLLVSVAGYLAVAGAIAGAVSQAAVKDETF